MPCTWFIYTQATPVGRLNPANYVPIVGNPDCPGIPTNICAICADIDNNQPVITAPLAALINAAGLPPFLPQPNPGFPKVVLTRA